MKTRTEVGADKLRGGFYTPARLVQLCLDRVQNLNGHHRRVSVLEPSAGDGAFLRGLAAHPLSSNVHSFLGIEIVESEAQKCRQVAASTPFPASVASGSAIEWASRTQDQFDVVLGNPPFVRYQFVSPTDLRNIESLGKRVGIALRGVSNLWIPVLLGALARLRAGGAMAFVLPSEIFTGLSAGDARAWLLANMVDLRVDMFEPGSFPDVLQQVIVISGRRAMPSEQPFTGERQVVFVEHHRTGSLRRWRHSIPTGTGNWTRYLLTSAELDALSEAQGLPDVMSLGTAARIEVSTVTGANDFFSINSKELTGHHLEPWALALLPRVRHATGLIYTAEDHEATAASGAKAWLLDFAEGRADPQGVDGASSYLRIGESHSLHLRYKTRIRVPWYRVPVVKPGSLMLSKRSHTIPRLILNKAGVVTTDTIYRGQMLPPYAGQESELVTSFHNSLTLVSAELEGRSFGGGVLELVPSEIARLLIIFPVGAAAGLSNLDEIARGAAGRWDTLVAATDNLLQQTTRGLTRSLIQRLGDARWSLLRRRLSRN
jgi:adenine-specific DNA methylase